ncbi:hypothetical protein EVAR_31539_1 [Eumeta japonica]|uniref:Uncharacterized protein n=1 Tax=Eumeta variegata TaxID=151549 RepID=A0A4C1V7Z1_EUMVA|nr:hypothetical protein EVAR_31539_1 [Eumeta japonica]
MKNNRLSFCRALAAPCYIPFCVKGQFGYRRAGIEITKALTHRHAGRPPAPAGAGPYRRIAATLVCGAMARMNFEGNLC